MFRNQSILQEAKKSINQIQRSGLAFSGSLLNGKFKQFAPVMALCLCLFLVGSCNEQVELFDFSKKPASFEVLSQGDLVRYGYAVQTAMIQGAENIKKLRAQDISLALSLPDLDRQDGLGRAWQYRTGSCIMDIFWKMNAQQSEASHVEFRARREITEEKKDDVSKWKCVQEIIQQRREKIDAGFVQEHAGNQVVFSLNAHKS